MLTPRIIIKLILAVTKQVVYPLVLLGVLIFIAIQLRAINKKLSQAPTATPKWEEWK